MKKAFALLTILFCFIGTSFAQIGRHELQIDTIPIGGQIQQEKMNRMNGHDEIVHQFQLLRDSVIAFQSQPSQNRPVRDVSKAKSADSQNNLNAMARELDQWIERLESGRAEAGIQRVASSVLRDFRRRFNSLQADSTSSKPIKN